MADNEINVNALPVKTAPSTGDKMLMIGSAEEYQIDYDQLASAILDKLLTKQYSELDTNAKTVLGALDELNGKWQPECEMIFNETEETQTFHTEIPENSIIFACKKTDVSTASIFTFNSSVSEPRINFIGNSNDFVYGFSTDLIQIAANVIVRIYKFK